MDRGPHSKTCADAVSGMCHCDCHGAQHGIGHLAGSMAERAKRITATAVKGDGDKVSHYKVSRPDGLPPGGGTKEEKVAHRAAEVKVTDSRSTADDRPGYTPPRLATYAARRDRVKEIGKVTRTEFDALPADQREKTLDDLRKIAAHNDTHSYKGSYGITSRSTADHIGTAKALIHRFTMSIPKAEDNTPAGRAKRLVEATDRSQARRALDGATKADMDEIARINRWGGTLSWKADKWREHLIARAIAKG